MHSGPIAVCKKLWYVLLFWKGVQTYNEVCRVDVDTTAPHSAENSQSEKEISTGPWEVVV